MGRESHNKTMQAYLKLLGTKRHEGAPYRHQAQGLIEIRNRHVQQHVRALIWERPELRDDWAVALPIAQRIINCTVFNLDDPIEKHVAPIELMFCGRISPDRHLFKPALMSEEGGEQAASRSTIKKALSVQKELIKNADEYQRKQLARRKEREADSITAFVRGQHVLLAPPDGERPPDKLSPKLTGPYLITKAGTSRIHLKNLANDVEFSAHGDRLRPFYECGVDPATIAARPPSKEYTADCTLSHRLRTDIKKPSKKNPSHYEPLVSWADYPSSCGSCEPHRLVRGNSALNGYLDSVAGPPECLLDTDRT